MPLWAAVTAGLYFTTACFAIFAPKIRDHDAGPIRAAQGSGLDSWPGDDPDAHLGRDGL